MQTFQKKIEDYLTYCFFVFFCLLYGNCYRIFWTLHFHIGRDMVHETHLDPLMYHESGSDIGYRKARRVFTIEFAL